MEAAVAVISQLPMPTIVNAPVVSFTMHTVEGVAEYSRVVCAPPGAVTVGAVDPNATEEALYWNPLSV